MGPSLVYRPAGDFLGRLVHHHPQRRREDQCVGDGERPDPRVLARREERGRDDGSEREFEITEKAQYDKEELPFDRVFSKTGEPSVVLITCGGNFNRALDSYDDNVVVIAIPTDLGT